MIRDKDGEYVAIVKDYYVGNTHIRVHDDYCLKTKEEVDAVLKRIGNIYTSYLTRKAYDDNLSKITKDKFNSKKNSPH